MNKPMTSMELETLEYRKSRLRSKLSRLEELVSGQNGSILPLVRGEEGGWSEERGRALIGELLEALELIGQGDGEEPPLTEGVRKAFESFLYCALRALESPMPTRHWAAPLDGGWNGLLALAGQIQFRDKYALYFGEAYDGLEIPSFFFLMNEMYATLTGERAVDQVSPEELAVMEDRFRDEIAECKAGDEIHRQWQEALEQGELDAEPLDEEMAAEEQEEAAAVEAWKEGFSERESFFRAYFLFREAFFEARAWTCLRPQLERMVDVYLYRQGTSSFLTDDAFFLAYGLLDQSEQRLRDTLKGAR